MSKLVEYWQLHMDQPCISLENIEILCDNVNGFCIQFCFSRQALIWRTYVLRTTWATALSNSMKLWAMLCRPLKTGGSWWRVLTKRGPLEKGMTNHFSILALRTPWIVWKGKKIGHWKMNSPGQQVSSMLLENSGEITPERMKGWSQSKNTQLWMWLVI